MPTGSGVKEEAGMDSRRNWAAIQSQLKPQSTSQGALELGRPLRLSWVRTERLAAGEIDPSVSKKGLGSSMHSSSGTRVSTKWNFSLTFRGCIPVRENVTDPIHFSEPGYRPQTMHWLFGWATQDSHSYNSFLKMSMCNCCAQETKIHLSCKQKKW